MSLCRHPNVLRVVCSFVHEEKLYLVTPFLAGGSCLDIMKTAFPEGIDEVAIATILKQALQGLEYMHSHGHIHRDVKAGNLLVDDDGTVRLADFGVSSSLMETGERGRRRKTFVGTPCWMAPEVMEQTGYDYKADMWSFGITCIELATGHAPYAKYPPLKVLMLTLNNEPPTLDRDRTKYKYSKTFKELIDMCLQKEARKRPSAEKLLQHAFFKQAKKKQTLQQTLLKDLPPLETRQQKRREKKQQAVSKAISWDFSDDLTPTATQELKAIDANPSYVEPTTEHDVIDPLPGPQRPPSLSSTTISFQLPPEHQPTKKNVQKGRFTVDEVEEEEPVPSEVITIPISTNEQESPLANSIASNTSILSRVKGRFVVEEEQPTSVQDAFSHFYQDEAFIDAVGSRKSSSVMEEQVPLALSRDSSFSTASNKKGRFEVSSYHEPDMIFPMQPLTFEQVELGRRSSSFQVIEGISATNVQNQLSMMIQQNMRQNQLLAELQQSISTSGSASAHSIHDNVLTTLATLEQQVRHLSQENEQLRVQNAQLRQQLEFVRSSRHSVSSQD
jgi:serine/threonine protein kinase